MPASRSQGKASVWPREHGASFENDTPVQSRSDLFMYSTDGVYVMFLVTDIKNGHLWRVFIYVALVECLVLCLSTEIGPFTSGTDYHGLSGKDAMAKYTRFYFLLQTEQGKRCTFIVLHSLSLVSLPSIVLIVFVIIVPSLLPISCRRIYCRMLASLFQTKLSRQTAAQQRKESGGCHS